MADVYAAGLAGRAHGDIAAAAKVFIKRDNRRVFKYVRGLSTYLESRRLGFVVITGAPEEIMREYSETVGFSLAGSLRLEVKGGFYTGNIATNCGLYEQKQHVVQELMKTNKVVMAFGDSVSDLPLLDSAPVAFVVLSDAHTALPFGPHLIRTDPSSPPNAKERQQSLSMSSLLIGVIGSLIAAVVSAVSVGTYRWYRRGRGLFVGTWDQFIPAAFEQPAMMLCDARNTANVTGVIQRLEPTSEAWKRWGFEGRVRENVLAATFWSTDPGVNSFGTMLLVHSGEHRFEGYYIKHRPAERNIDRIAEERERIHFQ